MGHWLEENWSWVCATVFIAVLTSTTIGFKEGSKGGAIFVSNFAAAITGIALYAVLREYYSGFGFVCVLGMFCGACGLSVFGVLISLRNLIDRRRDRLAGVIMDRVAPGVSGEDK